MPRVALIHAVRVKPQLHGRLLAAKARSTLLATAQVVRSFDGSGSDALANQDLYRGVAATLRDLEGALALFGDKVSVAPHCTWA